MSEGKGGMRLVRVSPAIAYVDAFLVFLVDDVSFRLGTPGLTPGPGIGLQGVGTDIVE